MKTITNFLGKTKPERMRYNISQQLVIIIIIISSKRHENDWWKLSLLLTLTSISNEMNVEQKIGTA